LQVVEHLCAALDEVLPNSTYVPHRQLIQFVLDRPGHDRRYAIDSTKISTELGWQPRTSLGSGLQKTVAWYISHPEWVEAIRKQGEYRLWMEKNYEQRK
jgi:dTDP-glucose 4,6-dehydratase